MLIPRFGSLALFWSAMAALVLGPTTPATAQATGPAQLSGRVTDQTGLAIGGSTITLQTMGSGSLRVTRSDGSGIYRFRNLAPDSYELLAEATGFSPYSGRLQLDAGQRRVLDIQLEVLNPSETVTVTPARGEQLLADTAASVSLLDEEDFRSSPALVLDDALRRVPSFSLFRRSSSLTAHPTSQGVSLRGIGPSGVSRTLVLLDGFPYNDPFGGWVYWNRVPLSSIERVEIVEGTSSNLYGNYAMGGVIHVLTRPPARDTILLEGRLGNRETAKLDFLASDVWGDWGLSVDGAIFHTDGFEIIAEDERGQVDLPAASEHASFNLKLDYAPSEDFNFFLKGSYSGEGRDNGTVLQTNDTQWRFFGGGLRYRTPDESEITLSIFSVFQNFGSNFSAVAADRNSERLALTQEVPTHGWGGFAQWSKPLGSHRFSAGTDWRWTEGESQEIVFIRTPAVPVRERQTGGRQRAVGVFLQDAFNLAPGLEAQLSARVDHWRNYRASRRELAVFSGNRTVVDFADKENNRVSARAGLLYHLNEEVSLWGAVGSGFRAPTLNELYRGFRVGDVVTDSNPDLGAERLVGTEGGLNYSASNGLSLRFTGFWSRIKDPVSNVTQTVTPSLITRQRQNLGRTRSAGFQAQFEYRPSRRWNIDGAYLFNDSTVREFPANPMLVDNHLAQVARHRFTLGLSYFNPRLFRATLRGKVIGPQFDDDLNQFPLGSYFVADLSLSRPLGGGTELFLAVENLFDREYPVRAMPRSIGTPLLIQGGIRFSWLGR